MTPFGHPVDPDVYCIKAIRSGDASRTLGRRQSSLDGEWRPSVVNHVTYLRSELTVLESKSAVWYHVQHVLILMDLLADYQLLKSREWLVAYLALVTHQVAQSHDASKRQGCERILGLSVLHLRVEGW